MYRNSTQLNSYVTHKAPLSNNNITSAEINLEDEITLALQEKKKQLDDEIAKFTAAKEQEFRDFEKELRTKKQLSRTRTIDPAKPPVASTSPSVLNLLGGAKSASKKDQTPVRDSKAPNGVIAVRKRPPPISKPTLSLDRLNITGETTPPLTVTGTPPNQSALTRQLSRSPNHVHGTFTPPRYRAVKSPLSTQTEADAFAGLFTPSYLPLLDSRDVEQLATPHPLTDRPEPERRSSYSAPSDSLSPTTRSQVKRALTAPTLPSSSLPLPSAMRTASGTNVRKQKHVTFQLADSAIVDPASSYEEMPSPSFDSETNEYERRDSETVESSDSEATATPASVGTPDLRSDGDLAQSLSLPLSVTSNNLSAKAVSLEQDEDVFTARLASAEDGGSGVGFFELDEELYSPKKAEIQRFKFDEPDVNEAENFHKTEFGSSSTNSTSSQKKGSLQSMEDSGGSDGIDSANMSDEDGGATGQRSIRVARPVLSSNFSSGSVPINIIKPSGSWVGSFGH